MVEDDELRKLAKTSMAAPHLSRAELLALAEQPIDEPNAPTSDASFAPCGSMVPTKMIDRLANVICWVGCAVTALLVFGGVFAAMNETHGQGAVFAFFAIAAVIVWLIGRGFRYVLSGR